MFLIRVLVFSQTDVVRHPLEHPTHIQAFMTLPTRPTAPSQAHLQGTQIRHIKANLAKEPALCQHTITLYGWTQTHIIDDRGERANVQHRSLLYNHHFKK